ncbi:MAG: hypothetical protein IJK23_13390 [Clostridia bacterium]|nr:hypothetical protein [Clostridia bacterium]
MLEFIKKIIALIKKLIALIIGDNGTIEKLTEDPGHDLPDPGEVICYYGCPNSKKAQKLQLGRKLYKL